VSSSCSKDEAAAVKFGFEERKNSMVMLKRLSALEYQVFVRHMCVDEGSGCMGEKK
jgi:hypothetical protein